MFKSSLITLLLLSSSKPITPQAQDYQENLNDYDPTDEINLQNPSSEDILSAIIGDQTENTEAKRPEKSPEIENDANDLTPPPEFTYHNYDMLTRLISNLATNNPSLVRTYTLGKSQQGRELWAIQITNLKTINSDPLRPHVKIVGNMHGDESVSRELPIQLAQSLVSSYKNENPRILKLLNELDIHIVPSANPDGFEASVVGCSPNSNQLGRQVAGHTDTNRDFPDPFLNSNWKPEVDKTTGDVKNWNANHAPETRLIMQYILQNHFSLSLNLHGGAVVASYPLDGTKDRRTHYSAAADDKLFRRLATIYAEAHTDMSTGKHCHDNFPGGITNGAHWYPLSGGMEDFNYFWRDCFEITIELTCCKYPPESELEPEWNKNKEALLQYIEQAYTTIRGFVKHPDKSVKNVVVEVVSNDDASYTPKNITAYKLDENSENFAYQRLLPPGSYKIRAVEVVKNKQTKWVDITEIEQNQQFDLEFEDSEIEKTENLHQHNHEQLEEFLSRMQLKCGSIMRTYSIGNSVKNVPILVAEFSKITGKHSQGVPEIKLIGGQHGNEAIGRELLIKLIEFLCESESEHLKINGHLDLLDGIRLHILPEYNPDGYKIARVGDTLGVHGRPNANEVDLNRNFPRLSNPARTGDGKAIDTENQAIIQWSKNIPFILSADFHGGDLVVNYPWDNYKSSGTVKNSRGSPTPDDEYFRYISEIYANNNPQMIDGGGCDSDKVYHMKFPKARLEKEKFPGGIVNGAVWYEIDGGMQDWNYWNQSCFEVTVELGCIKYPESAQLTEYWNVNKASLLAFVKQGKLLLRGVVKDKISRMNLPGCSVNVLGIEHPMKTKKLGDFFRPLIPDNSYTVQVSCPGYHQETRKVYVNKVNGAFETFLMQREENIEHRGGDKVVSHDFLPKVEDLMDQDESGYENNQISNKNSQYNEDVSKMSDIYRPAPVSDKLKTHESKNSNFEERVEHDKVENSESGGDGGFVFFIVLVFLAVVFGVCYGAQRLLNTLVYVRERLRAVERHWNEQEYQKLVNGESEQPGDPNDHSEMLIVQKGGKMNYG